MFTDVIVKDDNNPDSILWLEPRLQGSGVQAKSSFLIWEKLGATEDQGE